MNAPAIKPIETEYNGYRFRSRLEARWAVFFDDLEIEYQYESEGYDLGKLGWYLPDFYLPKTKQFIGIKPKNVEPQTPDPKRIYAAGKILKNCWRHRLTEASATFNNEELPETWPIRPIVFSAHQYVGPYFTSCDHGCSHGTSLHGNGAGCMTNENINDMHKLTQSRREKVHKLCHSAIMDCDVFYAHIDTLDCYGTLAEIGFTAAARHILERKPRIYINIEESLEEDLWFALQYAYKVTNCLDPIEGLKTCMKLDGLQWAREITAEELKIEALAKAHDAPTSCMFYGDPLDNIEKLSPHRLPPYVKAAKSARGARFEHGE